MKASCTFAVGLALVLSARLGRAQQAETRPDTSPPESTAKAAGPAPKPAEAEGKPEATATKPAEPAAQTPATAPQPAAGSATTLTPEAKARAAAVQRKRIQTLNDNIERQEQAANPPSLPSGAPSKAKEDARASIARETARRDAAETALAALRGAKVTPEEARRALAVEKQELAALQAGAAPAADKEASETTIAVLAKAAEPTPQSPANKTVQEVELPKGDLLHYGPTVSLLRVSALRNPGEPGRFRNYEGRYEFVPAEFGFQFLFAPHNEPWRYQLANGKKFQLLSAGGMLLARIDKDDVQRGNLSIAATLSFFQEIIGLGVGVDLYRGVPVQGADGQSGSDTAFTGLLAWSLMRRGEVTPENVFFVVSLGLAPLVRSVTGEL